jgi:hypothetical protein
MRRGNFDRLVEPMNAQGVERRHVRMQSMSLATSIHDRSRERNYSCNAVDRKPAPRAPEKRWMMKRFWRLRQRAKNIAASFTAILACALNSILGGVALRTGLNHFGEHLAHKSAAAKVRPVWIVLASKLSVIFVKSATSSARVVFT